MKEQQAKELVIKAGLELVHAGLVARTWGNVSCRIDALTFAVTPSGKAYESLTPADIVVCRIEDASYTGTVKPSSEKGIHALVYRSRPDVGFVIHTHQKYASVASACPIHRLPSFGTDTIPVTIPVASYGLPGSKHLVQGVGSVLPLAEGALLMAHHGALCFGPDYTSAFSNARQLEEISFKFMESAYLRSSGASNFDFNEMKAYYLYIHRNRKRKFVRPMLDDFAQIIGPFTRSAADIDGLCNAASHDDAKAIRFIAGKNELAEMCASFVGIPVPIPMLDCIQMRLFYIKSYSKRK